MIKSTITRYCPIDSSFDPDVPKLCQSVHSFQSSSSRNLDMPPKCPRRHERDGDHMKADNIKATWDISIHDSHISIENEECDNFKSSYYRITNEKIVRNRQIKKKTSSLIGMQITIILSKEI